MVAILESDDFAPRARQLLLQLGDLRGGGGVRLGARGGAAAARASRAERHRCRHRRDAVAHAAGSLRLGTRPERGGRRAARDIRAFERLRQTFLELPVRLLQLRDGARADARRGALRKRRVPVAVLVVHSEPGIVSESQGVGVLLEHRQLSRRETQSRGVFALPLGAITKLVAQASAILLELLHLALQLRVERAELCRLNLGPELEVAEVNVRVLGDARLLSQKPRLLHQILHATAEVVGRLHRVANLLVRRAHLQTKLLEIAHCLAEAVDAGFVRLHALLRLCELLLRIRQRAIQRLETLLLLLQRLFLDVHLRLEIGVVSRLALERDVHLASDVLLELIVRLKEEHAQIAKFRNLRLQLLHVPRIVGVGRVARGGVRMLQRLASAR